MQTGKRYIETQRLFLREWKEEDTEPFVSMNNNQQVMEFFLKTLTREESLDFLCRIKEEFETSGFGLYAVERKDDGAFLGFTGLHTITFDIDFAPGVEIGWRFLTGAWGKGYATEAANACLEYAKEELNLKGVYSFTALPNKRSEKVMQRIGMQKVKEFDHPSVPLGHWLLRHVLYKTEF